MAIDVKQLSDAKRDAENQDLRFMLAAEKLSEETKEVALRLCTGTSIQVPISVIKELQLFGRVSSRDESFDLVSIQLSTESAEGRLLSQLANELGRLADEVQYLQASAIRRSLRRANDSEERQESFSTIQNAPLLLSGVERVQVPVSGYACQVGIHNYQPNRDIAAYSVVGGQNCQIARVDKLSPRWLKITHGALTGTPCGRQYSGKAIIDIQWA